MIHPVSSYRTHEYAIKLYFEQLSKQDGNPIAYESYYTEL